MMNRISLSSAGAAAGAMKGKMNTLFLQGAVSARMPGPKSSVRTNVAVYATALTLFASRSAFAQDVLGITPVETAFIAFLDIVAVMGIGWGFTRLMTGRHTVEGLFAMGVGVLGIAKAQTIVAYLGA